MKQLYTARLKALVKESGLSIVDFAALCEISHRRAMAVFSPSTTTVGLNLDTLVRFSVVLSVYLEREPEDVFYDVIGENLTALDRLWRESDKQPDRKAAMQKLEG